MPLVRGGLSSIDAGSDKLVVLSCPWFLTARSPAVSYISEAYEWREAGCMSWDSLPVFARRAVTAFSRGVNRRQHVDFEERQKEAERKQKQHPKGGR